MRPTQREIETMKKIEKVLKRLDQYLELAKMIDSLFDTTTDYSKGYIEALEAVRLMVMLIAREE